MVDIRDMVMSNMEYEADIIDATTLNSEYEAGIQAYQDRELNMNKKHKTRDVKDDISDAVVPKHGTRVWHQGIPMQRVQEARDEGWDAQEQQQGQVRREQEREQRDEQRGRPYQSPEMRAMMADIINTVMINMYEKPTTRNVMDNITDAVMLKHRVRGWRQDPLRKGV
jgi:hypothetical protein